MNVSPESKQKEDLKLIPLEYPIPIIAIEKYQSLSNLIAEVSKPGQPRGTQDPQNRKSLLSGVRGFKSHPLH